MILYISSIRHDALMYLIILKYKKFAVSLEIRRDRLLYKNSTIKKMFGHVLMCPLEIPLN